MQLLQGPAGLHELQSEIVEQFRVSRWITTEAEIARCADQPGTEVVHPHAIYDDARGQRILGVDDRTRQFQPPAPIFERSFVAAAQTRQEARRRQRTRVVGIAAEEYMRRNRVRQIFYGHRARGRAVIRGLRQHRVVADAD